MGLGVVNEGDKGGISRVGISRVSVRLGGEGLWAVRMVR